MYRTFALWKSEKDVPYFNPGYGQPVPFLTEFLLDNGKNDNPCIIVIPGGGYSVCCTDHEGSQICRYLNENGFSALYLNYRVHPYQHPVFETDALRAIRFVRYNAEKFGINPQKIGTIGFSAGGHLTCMTGLRFDYGRENGDEIDRVSSRPDCVAPCYAVASFNRAHTHMGTRNNCIGNPDNDELAFSLSSENIVRDDAPPFFLFHTAEDKDVPPDCSLVLASKLVEKGIPVELHLFPFGHHGVGLAKDMPLVSEWPALYVEWLKHILR